MHQFTVLLFCLCVLSVISSSVPAAPTIAVRSIREATLPSKDSKNTKSTSGFGFIKRLRSRGVGVSFVKSLTGWKQFGVGLKVPISAHFPSLEKLRFMPKVTSFLGVVYPQGINNPHVYRFAVTSSYSMEPILSAITHALSLPTKTGTKETTSVKRIGVTLSVLYNKYKGWAYSIGPFIQLFLSEHHIKTIILPLLLLLPAIVAAAVDYAVHVLKQASQSESEIAGACTRYLVAPNVAAETVNNSESTSSGRRFSSMFNPSGKVSSSADISSNVCTRNESKDTTECAAMCPYYSSHCHQARYGRRSVVEWIDILRLMALNKSTDLGFNLGYYWPMGSSFNPSALPYGGVMGSAAAVDIQSFRPIAFALAVLQAAVMPKASVSLKCA